MCNVARLAKKNGYVIIIITARPPTSEKATIANLNAYNIPYDLVIVTNIKVLILNLNNNLEKN